MDQGRLLNNFNFLKDALDKIQMKQSAHYSFNDIYFLVYEIVRNRETTKLHLLVVDVIRTHLTTRVKPIVTSTLNQFQWKPFIKAWQDHERSLECFRKLLFFFEDGIPRRLDSQSIQNLGIREFKREVFETNKDIIQINLLNTIKNERNGQIICCVEIKNVIDIILSLEDYSYYEKCFENAFVEETKIFYTTKLQAHLQNESTISYINLYEKYVHDEKARAAKYLHQNTGDKIMKILEDTFIKDNLDNLPKLEEDLHFILNTESSAYDNYLQTLYNWFTNYNCIAKFRQYISNIFREKGMSIIEGKKYQEHPEVVSSLLKLKERFCDYEKRCFKDDEIRSNIDSDFITIFNEKNEMPQYLALYIHSILKKEYKDHQEHDLEANIVTFLHLYKLIVDKDVFENFYKFNLEKRLLSLKPTSLEIENKVLLRLKTECSAIVGALEELIKDIEISNTHMEMFLDYLQVKKPDPLDFEFTIKVLKQGCWKYLTYCPCIFPPAFDRVFKIYSDFYSQHHNGRKLRLLSKFGDAQITGTFPNPKKPTSSIKYTFIVSTTQVVILLLFNDHKSLTLQEIHNHTDIPIEHLKVSLTPIALGKNCHKILNKSGDKSIQLEDVFSINDNFSSKQRRVKLPFLATTIEKVNNDSTVVYTSTEADRRVEIDAAIVRIMKTRRTLNNNSLISEVISLLQNRFKPNVMTINSRISHLIDKEYIEKRNDGTYVYLP